MRTIRSTGVRPILDATLYPDRTRTASWLGQGTIGGEHPAADVDRLLGVDAAGTLDPLDPARVHELRPGPYPIVARADPTPRPPER
jgi:hypothetical protein